MNFWKILRWSSAILFVVMVLVAWASSGHRVAGYEDDEAHRALEAFRHQVKQKMFEWEFAQAGQVVMEALNPTQMEDLMQDLLTDEALNEVQSRFNRVFAELDVEMSAMDSPVRDYVARSHFETLDDLQVSTVLQTRSRR